MGNGEEKSGIMKKVFLFKRISQVGPFENIFIYVSDGSSDTEKGRF